MPSSPQWLCVPRGAGVLWARRDVQAGTHPAVLSHGADEGFVSRFIWDGARDYSPVLAVPAALRFWAWLGGPAAVYAYQRQLLSAAVALLTQRWGTEALAPPEITGAMTLVRLPFGVSHNAPAGATSEHAKAVQDCLYLNNIEVPVKNLRFRLYVRLSAHVYNSIGDFEKLAEAVLASTTLQALLPGPPKAGVSCTRGGACG